MLKYSQDGYSHHWLRQNMSGIQISIATMEKNFQRTPTQSLKVTVSGNSSGLWKSTQKDFTLLESKRVHNVLMKPSNFLQGSHSLYDAVVVDSWCISCTFIRYTEEQFLLDWYQYWQQRFHINVSSNEDSVAFFLPVKQLFLRGIGILGAFMLLLVVFFSKYP